MRSLGLTAVVTVWAMMTVAHAQEIDRTTPGLALAQAAVAQQPAANKGYEFKGKVIALEEAEIAARVDGWVSKINFTAGKVVKQGDLLIEFDPRFKQIALAGAQARQSLTEAQLQLADIKLKNAQTLRARDVSSEIQLLEAKAQRDVTAATLEAAKADVQAAQLQLEETRLFAPIEGMMSRPLVREGAYFTLQALERSRLAVVTRLNPIQVVGEIPFNVYLQHRELFDPGTPAAQALQYALVLPNGDKYAPKGRLVGSTGEFNPASQTMAIAVEFENPNFLLRPGLNVTLQSIVTQ